MKEPEPVTETESVEEPEPVKEVELAERSRTCGASRTRETIRTGIGSYKRARERIRIHEGSGICEGNLSHLENLRKSLDTGIKLGKNPAESIQAVTEALQESESEAVQGPQPISELENQSRIYTGKQVQNLKLQKV